MYQSAGGAHWSLNVLWEIRETCHKIRKNNIDAREALGSLYEAWAPDKVASLEKIFVDLDDPSTGQIQMKAALADRDDRDVMESARQNSNGPFKDDADRVNTLKLAAAGPAMSHAVQENPRLAAQLLQLREKLREIVHGKAVLIGWAATSQVADTVPTPLHSKCPGVVIHGTIFNAIMTGRFLTRTPVWMDLLITTLFGVLTTVLASRLPPTRAFLCALTVALLYAGGKWHFPVRPLGTYRDARGPARGDRRCLGGMHARSPAGGERGACPDHPAIPQLRRSNPGRLRR